MRLPKPMVGTLFPSQFGIRNLIAATIVASIWGMFWLFDPKIAIAGCVLFGLVVLAAALNRLSPLAILPLSLSFANYLLDGADLVLGPVFASLAIIIVGAMSFVVFLLTRLQKYAETYRSAEGSKGFAIIQCFFWGPAVSLMLGVPSVLPRLLDSFWDAMAILTFLVLLGGVIGILAGTLLCYPAHLITRKLVVEMTTPHNNALDRSR